MQHMLTCNIVTMPAGVSWGEYLRYGAVALLSMLAGAQTVHVFYRPMEDMDRLVEAERKRLEMQDSSNKEKVKDRGS